MADFGMCACARTREFCLTIGCKRDEMEWLYTTEGRRIDHLRRVIRRRDERPVSRWLRPERAVAEAWRLNMERDRTLVFIEKLGGFELSMEGAP